MQNIPRPLVRRLLLLVLLCGALLWLQPLEQVAQAASLCCTECADIQSCDEFCGGSIACERGCQRKAFYCQTCDPGC